MVLALLYASPSTALRPNTTLNPCVGHETTAQAFQEFAEKTWRLPRWERPRPRPLVIRAYHLKLQCAAGQGHREAIKHRWATAKHAFYKHRRVQLWRIRVTPYLGGGGWWALPYSIVVCESGGNYHFTYGAYSILDPAWHAWGGKTTHAGEASKREQDRVAHYGWSHYGEGPWECKSDGEPHPF